MKVMNRVGLFLIAVCVFATVASASPGSVAEGDIILPQPSLKGDVSIEQALASRRSLRTYSDTPVTLQELSQLLWAAQGITAPEKGFRTAPSGMASYPLTVYAACFNITGLPQGIYRYEPDGHKLTLVIAGDTRDSFKRQSARPAAEGRGASAEAPAAPVDSAAKARTSGHADATVTAAAVFIITTDTSKSFGSSGYYLEAGHVGQNIVLQCVSFDMGGVTMAGFNADSLKTLLKLTENETPIYAIPVGKK